MPGIISDFTVNMIISLQLILRTLPQSSLRHSTALKDKILQYKWFSTNFSFVLVYVNIKTQGIVSWNIFIMTYRRNLVCIKTQKLTAVFPQRVYFDETVAYGKWIIFQMLSIL